jgi:hypothetical protein
MIPKQNPDMCRYDPSQALLKLQELVISICNIASLQRIKLPGLYETEKIPLNDKPIYIHFFIGACDWFISEYDGEGLFFGYAIIGDSRFAEWGYVSFTELKQIKVPPGIKVDCEVFDTSLKASEIEEINIH